MAHRVCPWWVGWFLAGPIRRFAHNPRKILAPYIRPDMTIMDLGPGMATFTLAFYMVHEVPDARAFFTLVRSTLAPGGKLLVVEPKIHVSACAYAGTVDAARQAGFEIINYPKIPRSRSALLAPL